MDRQRLIPRQIYGSLLLLVLSFLFTFGSAFIIRQEPRVAISSLPFALLFLIAGWWNAASPPSEKELEERRQKIDKKIKRLQERRP